VFDNLSKIVEILKRKEERKKQLEIALESLRIQLIDLGAKKIILFGSLNENEIDVNSDLDLFVLMPSSKTGKEWTSYIYENLERDIASDIIAYNEDEFWKYLPNSSFLKEINDRGNVIHEA